MSGRAIVDDPAHATHSRLIARYDNSVDNLCAEVPCFLTQKRGEIKRLPRRHEGHEEKQL